MIKYYLTASILKGFSATPQTRAVYRWLGNAVGARRRASATMPGHYTQGVRSMLELTAKHGVFKDGYRILEVGTGWMHWEALTISLFYDIQAVLFDVWDNRQLIALKNYLAQFGRAIPQLTEVSPERKDRAQRLIEKILRVNSFDELYRLLDFEYTIVSSGSLKCFADNTFDVIVSARVLEHIGRDSARQFAIDCKRVLKKGGFSLHSICIGDHLGAYDKNVSGKQYLAYSDAAWKRWFENQVQYINRLQKSEWLKIFESADLTLIESYSTETDITDLRIAERFKHYELSDLECYTLKMLHRN
jgi:SAM-dependent methyltransferase